MERKTLFSLRRGRFVLTTVMVLIIINSLANPLFQTHAYAMGTPTLIAPANLDTITATGSGGTTAQPPVAVPELSWNAVDGATKYRIQICQDIAFTTGVKDYQTPLTSFRPTAAEFADGLWYWHVRAEAPVAGFFSGIWSFTKQWATPDNKPALDSPSDGDTLEFFDRPAFSWEPVIGAAAYRFQVSASSDFSSLAINEFVLSTTFQPFLKLANGTYYWRVKPVDPGNRDGTVSDSRTFVLAYNQVPVELEPANYSTPTFTPTFKWTAVRGAQYYQLRYSTDPTFISGATYQTTRNTTFTPKLTLDNDKNYYWQVRTWSGNSISPWSHEGSPWRFTKQWYIRAKLLTPTDNFQHVRFPEFTWTPVPGASYYKFELSQASDFNSNYITEFPTNNYYTPINYRGDPYPAWYWRVTPYDANGKPGKESYTSSYYSDGIQTAPVLIYPPYYYVPDIYPSPDESVYMNPHIDRTVSYPIFIWHRLTTPPNVGGTFAYAYRMQVSTVPSSPGFENNIIWTVDTENTHAAPTTSNPFMPATGQDYYWRVRALDSGGNEAGNWSQIWRTRFNPPPIGVLPPTPPPPQLIRPVHGSEIVETTPLFEWNPVSGADSYDIQVSNDSGFGSTLLSKTVAYPEYSPTTSLAQRLLGRIAFGTFYWRVRARNGGTAYAWSDVRRFQIASQSERTMYNTTVNRLLVASDPNDTADDSYELRDLYVAQSPDFWWFRFNITTTLTNMSYALYLDLDHKDNSGATSDPRSYTVSTIPGHRPEYAIYVDKVTGAFSDSNTFIYKANGTGWFYPQTLNYVGGSLTYTTISGSSGWVDLKVPNTSIGMGDESGSYAISLFSVASGGGTPLDSVPTDPNAPGSGNLSRFASVSERMNQVNPPDNDVGNPAYTYPFVPPFYWDYPTGSNGTAPWAGAKMRVYLDAGFTNVIGTYDLTSNTAYYAPTSHIWNADFQQGDNTYYWRIQPRYLYSLGAFFGVWSQGGRFERKGFVTDPAQMTASVAFATPSFTWDMVEGAKSYDLWVDQDPSFGSMDIQINTTQTTYTHDVQLNIGTYYWKVRVLRNGNVSNEWSQTQQFTVQDFALTLPKPTGLSPNDPDPNHAINTTPTFHWDPLVKTVGGVPVMSAYKYRIQWSLGDPLFNSPTTENDTEQSYWTPRGGFADGTYYWRVAMIDGNGKLGGYSNAVFTKQYPIAKPLAPVNGSTIHATPTFTWTAADGVTPYVFGAASYRLEISQFPTFVPLYDSVTTVNTSFVPSKIYDINKTYYWRVAIVDLNGKLGPFSNATIIIKTNAFYCYLPITRH